MKSAVCLLSLALFVSATSLDYAYGHTMLGKVVAILFLIPAVCLAFASLGDEDKPKE